MSAEANQSWEQRINERGATEAAAVRDDYSDAAALILLHVAQCDLDHPVTDHAPSGKGAVFRSVVGELVQSGLIAYDANFRVVPAA